MSTELCFDSAMNLVLRGVPVGPGYTPLGGEEYGVAILVGTAPAEGYIYALDGGGVIGWFGPGHRYTVTEILQGMKGESQMSKHTPGPHPCHRCGGSWAIVNACGCDPQNMPTLHKGIVSRLMAASYDESLSTAMLYREGATCISDLLKLLRALVKSWDNGTLVHPGAEIATDARAAIARAEGIKAQN